MYNSHRQPHAASDRLNDILDQLRQEFNQSAGRAGEYEQQRKLCLMSVACRTQNPELSVVM
jgi:hypothetical protein